MWLITAMLSGFKSKADLQNNSFGLPRALVWPNYTDVPASLTFWPLLNSTTVLVAAAVDMVVLAAMPAFVFARMKFRGRELLFNFLTPGLLFPLNVAILPLHVIVVLAMVSTWNAFFLPLVVLNDTSLWTLRVGIMQFQRQFDAGWARILAFFSLALVPTVAFHLPAEK